MSQFTQALPAEIVSAFSSVALKELEEKFCEFDTSGDGTISFEEFRKVLYNIGEDDDEEKAREMMRAIDIDQNGTLNFVEFVRFVHSIRTKSNTDSNKNRYILKRTVTSFAPAVQGDGGASHVIPDSERIAFSNHINISLASDEVAARHLPLGLQDSQDLYHKTDDGIIYCKLINLAEPGTIDERAINKKSTLNVYQKTENLNLAIQAAKKIGCQVVNIGPMDLVEGRPVLVLGLIWQIIKIQLMSQISLKHCPELVLLVKEGEDPALLATLSPEDILLRWINHHLEKAGSGRRVTNFGSDMQDSECFSILLNQLNPELDLCNETDLLDRAEHVIRNARALGANAFVRPEDIRDGNKKLILSLVAQLFNTCPKLEVPPEVVLPPPPPAVVMEDESDSREERVFRMWINSLNLPKVGYLHSLLDLADGLVILHLEDFIEPGIVIVNENPKTIYKKIENCNYAVNIAKRMGMHLVNIGGTDIVNRQMKLILGIVWQLMRRRTLNTLKELARHTHITEIHDDHILEWANQRVHNSGKSSSIVSFKDSTIKTSLFLFDLISSIAPEAIQSELILTNPETREERLMNAKYLISIAMKIGASVFLSPEDIDEVKSKMIMSLISALWVVDVARSEANCHK